MTESLVFTSVGSEVEFINFETSKSWDFIKLIIGINVEGFLMYVTEKSSQRLEFSIIMTLMMMTFSIYIVELNSKNMLMVPLNYMINK